MRRKSNQHCMQKSTEAIPCRLDFFVVRCPNFLFFESHYSPIFGFSFGSIDRIMAQNSSTRKLRIKQGPKLT